MTGLGDELAGEGAGKEQVKWLADLLVKQGIDVADVGKVQKVNVWQGFHKDKEGESHKVDLVGLTFSPSWETGPEWPVVDRTPVEMPGLQPASAKQRAKAWKTAVIFPDQQIGYRRFEDGTLDPFHSEPAMDVAIQIAHALQHDGRVDKVVNLGDLLDLAPQSRHPQEPAFAHTTQAQIDRGTAHLALQRMAMPSAEIVYLEGNHDRRLQNFVVTNAMSAHGLRRGGAAPDSWPVLSIPYLLRLEEAGIKYVPGYPAGEYWINEGVVCFHGRKVKSSGSSAAATVFEETVTSIFGHVHRLELQGRTVRDRSGARRIFGVSPGCLCRTDGAVPSVKGSTDPFGRPVPVSENWQNGMAVLTYKEDSSEHSIELVHIEDGRAMFRGQEFVSAV